MWKKHSENKELMRKSDNVKLTDTREIKEVKDKCDDVKLAEPAGDNKAVAEMEVVTQATGDGSKCTMDKKSSLSGDALHRNLIEKCMAALHLCLSRFPTHYKSLYRLAYVYFYSPYHKVC